MDEVNQSLVQKYQGYEMTQSVELVESYFWSSNQRDLSIYSERLLDFLLEIAQRQVAGINFRDGIDIGQVSIGPLGQARIEIPVRKLLGSEDDTNYTQAKAAVMELMESPYYIERAKVRNGKLVLRPDGTPEMEFIGHQILNDCEVNVKPGFVVVDVNDNTWRAFLDFSKGFRKFDQNVLKRLTRICSRRIYKLISNQKNPISYSIDRLRWMLKMEDKYPDTNDFLKRTVDSAKKELDEQSPWTFTYEKHYSLSAGVNQGRRGKKAITSITLYPVQKLANLPTTAVLNMIGSPVSVLGRDIYNLLLTKFEFTAQGIKNNLLLFATAQKAGMPIEDFLYDIAPKAVRAVNPPGYVISSIEKHLKEKYGVEKTSTGYNVPKNC